jgi:L-seryl-tRNA(Ser) seleniumtransferase
LVLAVLQDVALSYLRRDAGAVLPFWRMATAPVESLEARARALGAGSVVACESVTGGGTLPGVTLPSFGVAFEGDITATLRRSDPPVVARVDEGRTICDVRTVLPEQDEVLAKALP